MKRLNAVESLARDICWQGFSKEGQRGKTKAGYWRSISDRARLEYENEAGIIVYTAQTLGVERIAKAFRDSRSVGQ